MSFMLAGDPLSPDTTADDPCPIARAVSAIGPRSSFLLLREGLYGTVRFTDLVARTGLTSPSVGDRLPVLIEQGLFERQLVARHPLRRSRHPGYVLTAAGEALAPAMLALAAWGTKHRPTPGMPSFTHTGCGAPIDVAVRCAAGHDVSASHVTVVS